MIDCILFPKDRKPLSRFIHLAVLMYVLASYLDMIKSNFLIESVLLFNLYRVTFLLSSANHKFY